MIMDDSDWEKMLQEWEDSYDKNVAVNSAAPTTIKGEETRWEKHIGELKETTRARFFMTDDTKRNPKGFWCPKAAILEMKKNAVLIANWCKLTIIEYR